MPLASNGQMTEDVYRELLIRHSGNPQSRGSLPQPTHRAEGLNPYCGDQVRFELRLAGATVAAVGFTGRSCAICTASASILAGSIAGHPLDEVRHLAHDFRALVNGSGNPELPAEVGLLANVRRVPGRVKCAVLPWETVLLALLQPVGVITHLLGTACERAPSNATIAPGHAETRLLEHLDCRAADPPRDAASPGEAEKAPMRITLLTPDASAGNEAESDLPSAAKPLVETEHQAVIDAIDLASLAGQEFILQGIRFRGIQSGPIPKTSLLSPLPHPCGFFGLTAEILSSGQLRPGNTP